MKDRLRLAAMIIVAVGLVLRMALPFALEWMIPRLAADQGLFVQIENIDLGLIAGEVTLEDVIVDFASASDAEDPAAEGADTPELRPLVALDRLHVAFEWTDLLFQRLHMTDFGLHHPTVDVTQLADGSFVLPEFGSETPAERSESDPGLPPEDAEVATESGWTFLLDRFELKDPDFRLRNVLVDEEVVHLSATRLEFDALSVDSDGIGLGGIDFENPELFVQRQWLLGGGQTSDPSAAVVEAPSVTEEENAEPTELPPLRMRRLKIEGAAFTVRTEEGPVEVALRLELTDAGTERNHTFPFDLGLQVDAAEIGIEGQLGLNPASFAGRLSWQNLSVPPFLLLAYPKLVPWLASCRAQGDLEIAFSAVSNDKPAGLQVSGSSSVLDLSFKHPETGELALGWDSLEIAIQEAFVPIGSDSEVPIRVELSRLALASPQVLYTSPADAMQDLLDALGDGSSDDGQDTEDLDEAGPSRQPTAEGDGGSGVAQSEREGATSSVTPLISIERLDVTKGMLRYVDRGVNPNHESKIEELRVEVEDLVAMPVAGAKSVSINGLIQSTGTFALEGEVPDGQGNLHFELQKLNLVSYDSLARSAGWQVESGTTSLVSDIVATSVGLETKNELVLHDLDVEPEDGSDFVSQFGMSVDVVLALLRDPSGDIPLSIPVAFDEGGAGVDVGPVLASAMRNALTGAIASPVKMLGMLVPKGGSDDSFGAMLFLPGGTGLTPEAKSQTKTLAEFVEDRPMLGLSLAGHWSVKDRLPLAREVLREAAISGDDFPEMDDVGFLEKRRVAAALRARASGDPGTLSVEDEATLERYIAAAEVSEARMRGLAKARATSLREALVALGTPIEAISLSPVAIHDEPSVMVGLDARGPAAPTSSE